MDERLRVALTAAIGAIALNLLVGTTGQLSLAQPFFLVVGAYGYTLFASQPVKAIAGKATVRSDSIFPR